MYKPKNSSGSDSEDETGDLDTQQARNGIYALFGLNPGNAAGDHKSDRKIEWEQTKEAESDDDDDYNPLKCKFCEQVFTNEPFLKMHCKIIHPDGIIKHDSGIERGIKCEICNKTFSTEESVNNHKKNRHRGERRSERNICYQCGEVFEGFSARWSLGEHIDKVHNGERFKCQVCKKNFPRCDIMEKHYRAEHPNDTVNCVVCKAEFKNPNMLRHHLAAVHEGVRYSCRHCDETFSSAMTRTRHMKEEHDDFRSYHKPHLKPDPQGPRPYKGFYDNVPPELRPKRSWEK